MCALFGVHGNYLSERDTNIFRSLGVLSCFRGIDSTGLAALGHKGEPVVLKEITNPVSFLSENKEVKDFLKSRITTTLMGHSRAATAGLIDLTNAHPFKIDHITGMHNGTIEELIQPKSEISDSVRLFERIAENGYRKTLSELSDRAAYALVFFDEQTQQINFIRNSLRPLYYTTLHDRLFIWASEHRMLEYVLDLYDNSKTLPKIHSFEENVPYYLPRNSIKLRSDDPITKEVKPESRPSIFRIAAHTVTNVVKGLLHEGYPYGTQGTKLLPPPPPPKPVQKTSTLKARFSFQYYGWQGSPIATKDARLLLECGCAYCEEEKKLNQVVHWINSTEYICSSCMSMPSVKSAAGVTHPSRLEKMEHVNES